ncbi:MAG TPA: hypothetical protein VH373_08675 [Jatrophihabitantaceae bacterium]
MSVQPDEPVTTLSRRGMAWRLAAVLAVLVLVIAGTVNGQDDDFPFGPFKMYSTRDDPNGQVNELRVQLLLKSGAVQDVTNASGAPRRAELEGRVADLTAHPAELAQLAPLYVAHASGPVRELRLVWLVHPLHDGRSAPARTAVICSTPVTAVRQP